MPLIRYDQLEKHLPSFQTDEKRNRFYLLFGDSYLIKQSYDRLSDCLAGKGKKDSAMEVLEGASVSMGDIIESASTFSFFFPKKIVAVKHAPLFQAHHSSPDACFSASDLERLSSLVANPGLPSNHYLILMADDIDKRRKAYKSLEENGWVVDCSIADGTRKADQEEQEKIFQSVTDQVLSFAGKTIQKQAFHLLLELTGADLELFTGNLEKLIVFTGGRNAISSDDVHTLISRDRKDPIFKLTNALMDKDLNSGLFFLDSMLKSNTHPLQILKLLENQIRKLLLVKYGALMISSGGKKLNFKTIGFNAFKQTVLPGLMAFDSDIKSQMDAWHHIFQDEAGKGKTNTAADLLLASNPQNAYPVFQVFQKSENFLLQELKQIIAFLSDLDFRLKSSSLDAKTALEFFIMKICRKGGFVYENENQDRGHHF